MSEQKLMSDEEKKATRLQGDKYAEAGEEKKANEMYDKIPLAPFLAKAAKEVYGAEYLKNSGLNLAEAEAEYGKDWLEK